MKKFFFRTYKVTALGQIRVPVGIVTLTNMENSIVLEMLIDTGADISLVPKSIGTYLGFRKEQNEKGTTITGIGGTVRIFYRPLTMKLGRWEFQTTVGWAENDDAPLVHGRFGVLNRFKVEFLNETSIRISSLGG